MICSSMIKDHIKKNQLEPNSIEITTKMKRLRDPVKSFSRKRGKTKTKRKMTIQNTLNKDIRNLEWKMNDLRKSSESLDEKFSKTCEGYTKQP